jgi:hypothetical protein
MLSVFFTGEYNTAAWQLCPQRLPVYMYLWVGLISAMGHAISRLREETNK